MGSYESARELFPLIQRGTESVPPLSYRTGLQYVPPDGVVSGALLRLWVKSRTAGSITDLKIWVPRAGNAVIGASDEFLMYGFAALAIAAAGVSIFTIAPTVTDCLGNKKAGPWPPQFEVEVIQAAASDMVWRLNVMWL